MSSKTTSEITWHGYKRAKDGIMRHLTDTLAWKHFDELHGDFALEVCNDRLGLKSDGFQPFNNSSSPHST